MDIEKFTITKDVNFPRKYILVIEDVLGNQGIFYHVLFSIFGWGGFNNIRFNFLSSCIDAAVLIESSHQIPDLIILDHDMHFGWGSELLDIIKEKHLSIPIITASGRPEANQLMMEKGASYHFHKEQIFHGQANELIKRIIMADTD
jgi:CheY-like chemotaxis protein|tara:strand:- start:1404 stop:1841 length:438 start_codon:yes stop_codon:yes gene_type:complete